MNIGEHKYIKSKEFGLLVEPVESINEHSIILSYLVTFGNGHDEPMIERQTDLLVEYIDGQYYIIEMSIKYLNDY